MLIGFFRSLQHIKKENTLVYYESSSAFSVNLCTQLSIKLFYNVSSTVFTQFAIKCGQRKHFYARLDMKIVMVVTRKQILRAV